MRSYKGAARGYRDLGNLPVPLQFDGDELPGLGEGIQRTVDCLGLVLGAEHTIGLGEELARWILGDQRDDLRALRLCKAWPAPGTEAVSETVYALSIEAVDALPNGLGVTAQFLSYLGCAKSPPATGDDAGAEDPVAGGVTAASKLADLPLFFSVFGLAGTE